MYEYFCVCYLVHSLIDVSVRGQLTRYLVVIVRTESTHTIFFLKYYTKVIEVFAKIIENMCLLEICKH